MKKLKILIICDRAYIYGGSEVIILNEKKGLIRRGHEVKILSSDLPNDKISFADYTFKGFSENTAIKWLNCIFNFNSYIKLKQVLREYKPDIIHLHNIFNQVSPSVLFAVGNIPTVLTLHSYELICPMGGLIKPDGSRCISPGKHDLRCTGSIKGYLYEVIKQFIHKYLLKKISVYIAPSGSIKRDFSNQRIISSPIIVIHNGIQLLKFSPIINNKSLLYVGRLSKEKGVDVLLRAIKIIKESVHDIVVDIVGDGPEKNMLINLSDDLYLNDNVRFIGSIPHNKIGDFYKQCTALIVPSVWGEPFGLVGIEAISIGRPVIASNVGGISEWLDDEKTGYLVEPGNSNQIAEKVIKLFSHKRLLEQMGKNERKKVEQFSIEIHVKKLEKIYQKMYMKRKKTN
jgi:glycosyltransferase involved in cell wall biosynthesis